MSMELPPNAVAVWIGLDCEMAGPRFGGQECDHAVYGLGAAAVVLCADGSIVLIGDLLCPGWRVGTRRWERKTMEEFISAGRPTYEEYKVLLVNNIDAALAALPPGTTTDEAVRVVGQVRAEDPFVTFSDAHTYPRVRDLVHPDLASEADELANEIAMVECYYAFRDAVLQACRAAGVPCREVVDHAADYGVLTVVALRGGLCTPFHERYDAENDRISGYLPHDECDMLHTAVRRTAALFGRPVRSLDELCSGIPPCPVQHDHNPRNDAVHMAWNVAATEGVLCGIYPLIGG